MSLLLLTLVLLQILPTPGRHAAGRHQPVSDLDMQHAVRVQRNPQNLRYTVSTDSMQATFAVGEVIRVTQLFERTGPPTLNLSGVSGDGLEAEFVFEGPAPVADPRAEFAAWSPMGGVGSILGSLPDFDSRYELRRTLNPRYSFRVPGRYRFFLTSYLPPKAVTSEIIEITIVPATSEWQQQALDGASRDFARTPDSEGRLDAARRMRLLGTASAAKVMARLLVTSAGGVVAQELRWGLEESPHHQVAWQDRDAAVTQAAPHSVPPDVIKTLALLALRAEEEKGAPNAERPYEDRLGRYKELLTVYRERQAGRREP